MRVITVDNPDVLGSRVNTGMAGLQADMGVIDRYMSENAAMLAGASAAFKQFVETDYRTIFGDSVVNQLKLVADAIDNLDITKLFDPLVVFAPENLEDGIRTMNPHMQAWVMSNPMLIEAANKGMLDGYASTGHKLYTGDASDNPLWNRLMDGMVRSVPDGHDCVAIQHWDSLCIDDLSEHDRIAIENTTQLILSAYTNEQKDLTSLFEESI